MQLVDQNATVAHIYTLTADQLRLYWYDVFYHPSKYATGKGSRKYTRALAKLASTLEGYKRYEDPTYNTLAEGCAREAEALLEQYGEQ